MLPDIKKKQTDIIFRILEEFPIKEEISIPGLNLKL